MIYHWDIKQHTDEWWAKKLAKFSASKFPDLFCAKNTATYKKVVYRVAFEKLTGQRAEPESYKSGYMDRGNVVEPEARLWYENETWTKVKTIGFVEKNEWIGCSPDGLPGRGMLQIKSPAFNTMMQYLLDNKIPSNYFKQMVGELFVCEDREYNDFLAYHPQLPKVIIRVTRKEAEKYFPALELELDTAIKQVKGIINNEKFQNDN